MDVLGSGLVSLPAQHASLIAAVFGLIFGSFFNVCIYRLPRRVSIVWPASSCPHCGVGIAFFDNVPVLSWLWLGARCRGCRQSISWRYPLVEAVTAAIFASAVARHGITWDALQAIVFLSLLELLLFIDFDHHILPDILTLPGAVAGLALAFVAARPGWPASLTGLLIGELGLVIVALTYLWLRGEEGLGEGDIKMLGMMGAFLGPSRLAVALLVGAVTGSVVGVGVIAGGGARDQRGAAGLKARLPFGTFLAIGGAVAQLWGTELVAWYAGRLLPPP